jgi:hypothetical protein
MMIEQIFLTTLLLGWLFYRFSVQDEERQQLLDLAAQRGIELSEERAARAAAAGTAARLRARLLSEDGHAAGNSEALEDGEPLADGEPLTRGPAPARAPSPQPDTGS